MSFFRRKQADPVPPTDPNAVRRRILVRGRVQGVGLRYQVSNLARRLGLTGWVRNESDGSVSMELQGPPQSIDRLLGELTRDSYIRIRSLEQQEIPTEQERGFRVQY